MGLRYAILTPTYNRPQFLAEIMEQLHGEITAGGHSALHVIVDDCSVDRTVYAELVKKWHSKSYQIRYDRLNHNHGREHFWMVWNRLFSPLISNHFDYVIALADDLVLCSDFIERTTRNFRKVQTEDPLACCMNIFPIFESNWGTERYEDGAFIADLRFLKAINYRVEPIGQDRFRGGTKNHQSSGVHKQLTMRMARHKELRIAPVPPCGYVKHRNAESVMYDPAKFKKRPATIDDGTCFVDGEDWHEQCEVSEPVIQKGFTGTCTIGQLKSDCVVLAEDLASLLRLARTKKRLTAVVPTGWKQILLSDFAHNVGGLPGNVEVIESETPAYHFAVIHNAIAKRNRQRNMNDSSNIRIAAGKIDKSVVIGATPERRVTNGSVARFVDLIPMGGVDVGKDTRVGAYSVIYRGMIGDTRIAQGAHVGAHVVIEDDAIIESDVRVNHGVTIESGAMLGRGCQIGHRSLICKNVRLCNKVVLLPNSVVTSDIEIPGIYGGAPAKLIREKRG